MKKIFTFVALLTMGLVAAHADCQDGPYALYVNGTSVYTFEDAGMSPDQLPQLHAVASLQQGDKVEFCNTSCDAKWFPQNVETGGDVDGSGNFTIEAGVAATCNVAGCYNFWWKKQENNDKVYIGTDGDCGGGQGGGQGGEGGEGGQGGGEADDVNWYAIGWINGADAGEAAYDVYDDNYLFQDGKLTIECKMGSYIAIKDHMGNYYYAEGTDNATGNKVTLKWANGWSPCQKWAILEGTQYIIIRSASFKGTITLETVDKATYDAYHYGPTPEPGPDDQAVENTVVGEKAHKTVIDGKMVIIRGDKMFDITGRQL